MVKNLIKLADYLDEKQHSRAANIVDIYINRVAQIDSEFKENFQKSDKTWDDEENIDFEDSTEGVTSSINKSLGVITLSNGSKINLEQHPLGQKILNYMKNVFHIADSGTSTSESEGLITIKDIDNLIASAFKYDEYLNLCKNKGGNPNPITPNQMRSLLVEAMQMYGHFYETKGFLDFFEIKSAVHNLYKHYEDAYIDQYFSEEITPPLTKGEASPYVPTTKDLTPEAKEKLWERNETKNLPDIEKGNKVQPNLRELKKEFPESWHSILFDK